MQVRLAMSDDAAALAQLYVNARAAAVPAVPPIAHSETDVRAWIERQLESDTQCWVTEDAFGLSGLCFLDDGWVDQLYVRPDSLGQGIGSALVRHAKQVMPSGLQLWTFQSNARAHRFYERHGFEAVEYTDGHLNEEKSPDVRYCWKGGEGQS